MAPAESVGGRRGGGVGEHWENEAFGVPEGVAVVAWTGQTLRGNRSLLGAGAGLQRVEEPETDGLLKLRVPVELDVRRRPEVVEILTLAGQEALPAGVLGLRDSGDHLVANGRQRALARPAVGKELDDRQPFADGEIGGDRHPAEIRFALGERDSPCRAIDGVVHRGRHQQLAAPRRVSEHDSQVAVREVLRLQRRLEQRGRSRIVGGGRPRLVGNELRLYGDPQRLSRRAPLRRESPPRNGGRTTRASLS